MPDGIKGFSPEANDAGGAGGLFAFAQKDDSPILSNPTPSGSLGDRKGYPVYG